jgi:hypothetical protein
MASSQLKFDHVSRPDEVLSFNISIFMELNEHDRQLVGSTEINGPELHDMSGNECGMKDTCAHFSLSKGLLGQKFR